MKKVLQNMKNTEDQKCINGSDRTFRCKTETIHSLGCAPEVLTFNLNWNGDPIPGEILNLMISVPLEFNFNELIASKNGQFPDVQYALKGLICYQSTGHYLAFFRRLLTKPHCLVGADVSMRSEISQDTEWTLFDDAEIVSKGTWNDVVSQCIEIRTYPTVLLYEKINPQTDELIVNLSKLNPT